MDAHASTVTSSDTTTRVRLDGRVEGTFFDDSNLGVGFGAAFSPHPSLDLAVGVDAGVAYLRSSAGVRLRWLSGASWQDYVGVSAWAPFVDLDAAVIAIDRGPSWSVDTRLGVEYGGVDQLYFAASLGVGMLFDYTAGRFAPAHVFAGDEEESPVHFAHLPFATAQLAVGWAF